ncbi:hypothetical protein [Neisseria meningitidis]|nr:hypothetical protein [Neisseria meningitidis]
MSVRDKDAVRAKSVPDRIYSGLYSGLTKTSTALPRLSSKRTIL